MFGLSGFVVTVCYPLLSSKTKASKFRLDYLHQCLKRSKNPPSFRVGKSLLAKALVPIVEQSHGLVLRAVKPHSGSWGVRKSGVLNTRLLSCTCSCMYTKWRPVRICGIDGD